MRRIRPIARRSFLRGIGGVAIALPALEIMTPRTSKAGGGAAPKRYVVAFVGSSIGRTDGAYAPSGETTDLFVPDATGAGYDLKRALAPLGDLVSEVSVVSGMTIPWDTGSGIPAAGRQVVFHESTMCPLICGVRGTDEDDATGPTSDQVVAATIGGDAAHAVLPVCVQAASYRGSNGSGGASGTLSYRMGTNGLEKVAPFISPRLLFESLFTGFVPPDADPAAIAEAQFQLARRKSVIDLAKGDAERLLAQLGGTDKQRMERHFDELRELEQRLDMIEPLPEGECMLPASPGDDPPIGNATETSDASEYDTSAAWSDEQTRALVHTDLLHMALACDLTRSVALQYTYAHCWLNMYPVTGHTNDLHELGHGGSGSDATPLEAMSDGIAWHIEHWARFVAKLRDTTDFDGQRMLDNTAIVLVFEGGHGYDPEGGDQNVHSSENMAALIAGRVGGLNPTGGKHIVKTGEHPTRVITSAMQAVGAGDTLGEVAGVIPELFE
ncbi:MAG TPA: DUF1552 domain-containing protein [Nannocystaceae bacterium]|nr:DUF1552 domain-containing protein [Nannocystaceae bacterium]